MASRSSKRLPGASGWAISQGTSMYMYKKQTKNKVTRKVKLDMHFKALSNRHVRELPKTKAEFECDQISRNQKIIKMQSRLATTATRFMWVLSSSQKQQCLQRNFVAAVASTGRTVDPAIHSGEPHGAKKVTESEAVSHRTETEDKLNNDVETEPLVRPKPPHITSPRLQSKDGTPLPGARESEQRDENEKVEADREYFKHRKPSSLSEVEMADTRKPITQATSSGGMSDLGAGKDVIGWKPEQLVSAEETLMRAAEFWRQNAMRGDPDTFPHSRVLRELRGEWF
ncbi:hypothetical protein EZV62_010339 [Acer yangbiense]|uniref:Uncharacterized protein n=1 Tax=Acer yangbiense TaxID=1000413 RepID=A0A5C7I2N2_9ROSI|nr:hypothetical protein EZV62_010339 [Acer yangbiense]